MFMNLPQDQIHQLTNRISEIIKSLEEQEQEHIQALSSVSERYSGSGRNLVHYGAFRGHDIRTLQQQLKLLGLSRLANAEGNILGSLISAQHNLFQLGQQPSPVPTTNFLNIGEGRTILNRNTELLFGGNRENRRVRIMVTQPTLSATDYDMVLEMVKDGMDCARVNCAHDNPKVWKAIIDNVRKAAKACSREVKIAMDLAGPKIRTGQLTPGPMVRKFRPMRSDLGHVLSPAEVNLVSDSEAIFLANTLPVSEEQLQQLQLGDVLTLTDSRGKKRKLSVVALEKNKVTLNSYKTLYVTTGTELRIKGSKKNTIIVGELPKVVSFIPLYVGNTLLVTKNPEHGSLPVFDTEGKLVEPGKIPCIPASIVSKAKEGEAILFDDGKIEGVIEKVHSDYFEVRIVKASVNGSKLRAEKGINFPTMDLGLSGLTEKDRQDLEFVAQYADIVNYSFVNTADDVQELLEALERLHVKDKLGLILKIETRFAYRNLFKILLAAMQTQQVGVMIARGDLALEVGWKNMGKVQEEILSICSAAHVPVVWATQVLEGLAKNGLPSRSEITDITSSIRAECVMLNKGPYINEAIKLLDEILGNMESLHDKKEGMWPKIDWL